MRAGNLRHRITIQEPETTRDSYGSQTTVQWVNMVAVWASIEPVSGREYFASRQTGVEVTTKITIRYLEGLRPVMRVKYGDRYLEIVSIINIEEKNQYLELMCKEAI